ERRDHPTGEREDVRDLALPQPPRHVVAHGHGRRAEAGDVDHATATSSSDDTAGQLLSSGRQCFTKQRRLRSPSSSGVPWKRTKTPCTSSACFSSSKRSSTWSGVP